MSLFLKFFMGLFLLSQLAKADEGMWLLNHFPSVQIEKKYSFKPTQEWLDHVRLSAVRLAGGCSASFVSPNGLVMTNHHCAHTCIEQLSNAKKDYVASGFYAQTLEDEVKCPEIEVNQLTQITDVTVQIKAATKDLKDKAFNEKLKATMSKLETECSEKKDKLRCDVVTLYHGGKYHLYKYRRFQDVRLAFAPEFATAFFGGDPDNFRFPRYDFDISFLRVYENNKPLATNDYFRFSRLGAKENDLTFVAGHPGKTSRLLTVAELEFYRDVQVIERLLTMSELRGMLTEFSERGPEQRRTANAPLFSTENGLKALKGHLAALKEKGFMENKMKAEKAFRQKIDSNPQWKKEYSSAWTDLEKTHNEWRKSFTRTSEIEWNNFGSRLFTYAKTLTRASAEYLKPNEKRLREFSDSNRPQVKMLVQSKAPIHEELEIEMMTFYLTKFREKLTADDSFVQQVFGKNSPRDLATSLIKGTQLADVKVRQALFEGGVAAIEKSQDPMIQFFRLFDPEARTVRQKYEDEIESKIKQADEKVAQADFAVHGDKNYPDATFTLRLSYGQMKGYEENGQFVKPQTEIAGAFTRHTGKEPFALPETWLKSEKSINGNTPLNFCTTNDIIGGNSGSPVINQAGEVVGLIFDGNIQSLGGNFGYDEKVNRAVAVHSAGILELLSHVYHADRIVKDLADK